MIEASENISIVKVGALWEYLGALIKEQKIREMPINKAFPDFKNNGDGGIRTHLYRFHPAKSFRLPCFHT